MGYRYVKKCNTFEKCEGYMIGYTDKGESFKFDESMFDIIKKYYWFIEDGYVRHRVNIGNGKRKRISMHILLLSPNDGEIVDHINRDRSDNRLQNLRVATKSQNAMNSKISSRNKYGCKGVIRYKSGYRLNIVVNSKVIYLGFYENLEDAIIARKNAEIKYFGNFRINFDAKLERL